MTKISTLMTPAPLPIDAEQSLAEALQRMDGLGVHHLPVIRERRVLGMVSEAHVLRYLREHPAARLDGVLVTQVMSDAFTVTPDAPAEVVARAMVERGLDAAIVLDADRLVGLFTPTDAVRALAEVERGRGAASGARAWPRRILCAVDFSRGSREAARVALDLARIARGAVTLFHAFDLPGGPMDAIGTGPELLGPIERETDALLESLRAELHREGGPPIEIAHGLGAAAATIVGHARAHGFDVIVVGTHGRSGLRRVLLGSVAESVVRHAPCPVLVVRQGEAADAPAE